MIPDLFMKTKEFLTASKCGGTTYKAQWARKFKKAQAQKKTREMR